MGSSQNIEAGVVSRRERKKLETRRRIFDAAVKLMSEIGYDNVKIDDICELADVSGATFFLHFPTKSSLQTAFVEVLSEQISAEIVDRSARASDKLRLMQELIFKGWSDASQVGPRVFSAFVQEPGIDFDIEHPQSGLTRIAMELFESGRTTGEFRPDFDPEVAAVCLTSSWIGLARIAVSRDDTRYIHRSSAEVLDILCAGLRP